MLLPREESLEAEISEGNVLRSPRSKKKHKRLDLICEKVYVRNHHRKAGGVRLNGGSVGGNEGEGEGEPRGSSNGGSVVGDESEPRRSSRVRRAPEILDASPVPSRKRRRVDVKEELCGGVDRGKREVQGKSKNVLFPPTEFDEEESLSGWKTRLRTKGGSAGSGGKRGKESSSVNGRRKLFVDYHELGEGTSNGIQESDSEEEVGGERPSTRKAKMLGVEVGLGVWGSHKEGKFGVGRSAARSKRTKRVTVLRSLENKEIDSRDGTENGKEENKEITIGSSDEGNGLDLNNGIPEMVERAETENSGGFRPEEHHSNDDAEMLLNEIATNPAEHQNDGATEDTQGREHHFVSVEVDGATENMPKFGEQHVGALEVENITKDKSNVPSKVGNLQDKLEEFECIGKSNEGKKATENVERPIRIKEGRRCGLCGGGIDGKLPKKLVHGAYGSDDDFYSGSSASEEHNYDSLDGFPNEPGWLGRLLGPVNDRFGIANIWVHQQCAVWSPEVYFAGLGCLKNVRAALYRGRVLKCSRCGRPGATIGCRVDRCPKTYHLPCARDSGSIFDHRKFLIACTDHRHIFQPQGSQYIHRVKKLKLRKLKLEVRKVANDASRKDIEAEEKWLEHCGEDEEFLKRESKRLHRDLLRIAPTYIGGSGSNGEMQFQGWDSVAGLQDVIQCMKEVVILPLLYPEFFSNLGITPPRGVLLHGYPGTGKTLVVRALIGSCARGDKRIAYFARKGADCLGKYVGDAERQLRLLFQVAEKSQPSIIFFDEIDGLAPSRSRNQDQTHGSVVSTLLALMDGLKSRGSVVVIGATNRPDSIDPALRRPGRFDREIYFPLPSVKDREAILSLHTQKWPKQISGPLLKWVARRTVGFAGADLQALCTQAAIIALRRNFPLKELLASAGENALLGKRPPLPSFNVEERDWLDALSLAPPPCSHREAGVAANDVISLPLPGHLVPCLLQPLSKLIVSLHLDERVWLPSPLLKAATLIKNVIVSGLAEKEVLEDRWWSHVHHLLQKADVLKEIEDKLSRTTILADSFGMYDSSDEIAEDSCLSFKPSRVQRVGAHPGLSHSISSESNFRSGFRILISGEARSGQRHLSSCLLHCFNGNIEIRKLDLATLFQEGQGDAVQGLTSIMMRCASVGSCMLFMPRIDLWAMETCNQSSEEETPLSSGRTTTEESAENPESQNEVKMATYLWNSFIEQVESIYVRTPLMILATSEVLIENLPSGVKKFFSCEMLDCGLINPYKDTVPRFVMEIDGNLNPVTAANASVGRLLADLVQYFIHLLRHGIHVNSRDKLSCNYEEVTVDPTHSSSDPGSITQGEDKHSVPPVTLNNVVREGSSLLTAIATYGYQILKYPHFAELCWVTSKLKEGPSSRINGPLKGWPFNKCIACPVNSKEEVAVTSTSNAAKSMNKPCVVRGLIAVGLSAYRGEYSSLRVFSSEIRKVLELLVGCVETKIQAGKNKYKFFRLLSQVAYFEDMVISWAYSLQSLEVDPPYSEGRPQLNDGGKESIHIDGGNANNSNGFLNESEALEQIPQEAMAKDTDDHCEELAAAQEEVSVRWGSDNSACVSKTQIPLLNRIISETHLPTDNGLYGDLEGSKCSNGFLQKNSAASENKQGTELSNGVPLENGMENSSWSSLKVSSGSKVPTLSCMYNCCPHCLTNLYQVLLKLVNDEWKLKRSSETVEDFHDVVASISISLQSEVRKLFAKDSLEMHNNSGRVIEPVECSCHSTGGGVTAEEKLLQNARFDPNLKFCFRDGVLVAALDCGGGHEDPLHCKFERLSLSSLVDCIAARNDK